MLEIVPDIAQSPHGNRNIFADIRNVPTRPHTVLGMFLLAFSVMPMDTKEPVSVGKRCAARAANGNEGRLRVAVCVLRITCPLGRETEIPSTTGLMSSSTSASEYAMKLPVVPVSTLIEWVVAEEELRGRRNFC